MSYGGQTRKYKIPHLTLGDVVDASTEQRRAFIFDNQLFGAIRAHSGGHGVIQEGIFTSTQDPDGSFRVTVNKDSVNNLPAIEAFINQIYVRTNDTFAWTGLVDEKTYGLFIRLVETETQSSLQDQEFITDESDTTTTPPEDGLLLATVTISGGTPTVSTTPAGKELIPLLSDHEADTTNPHGTTLNQTNLFGSGLDVLGDADFLGTSLFHGTVTFRDTQTFENTVTFKGPVTFQDQVTFQAPVNVDSGQPIDGVDISELTQLVDGSNVGNLHVHDLSAEEEILALSPWYPGSVLSGFSSLVDMTTNFKVDRNAIAVDGAVAARFGRVILEVPVPQDLSTMSGVQIDHRVDEEAGSAADGFIGVRVFDTGGAAVTDTHLSKFDDWATTMLSLSGGTFEKGKTFLVYLDVVPSTGASAPPSIAFVGSVKFVYKPDR